MQNQQQYVYAFKEFARAGRVERPWPKAAWDMLPPDERNGWKEVGSERRAAPPAELPEIQAKMQSQLINKLTEKEQENARLKAEIARLTQGGTATSGFSQVVSNAPPQASVVTTASSHGWEYKPEEQVVISTEPEPVVSVIDGRNVTDMNRQELMKEWAARGMKTNLSMTKDDLMNELIGNR